MNTDALPSNGTIGALIGMTHSGVSRIRSGDRLPSLAAMRRIETAFNWPLADQAAARERNAYAAEFEKRAARVAA